MTPDTVRAPAESFRRPSRGLRQMIPWLLALAVATCTQDNVGPSRGGVGYFSFRPAYPMASGMSLSQFGIVADSVHILLTRPVDELVLDTTVAFPADSAQLHLALPVELASSPEVLDAVIEISAGGVVIFRDSVQVTVKDGAPGSEPPPVVTFDYVGPGSNIGSLVIAPSDTTIILGDTLSFTANAFDSAAGPVASFYVAWRTSDTLIARINANGRLIAPLLRGTVRVIGVTPTGIADTTVVTFAPVPVIITADSGGGQNGIVGDSLGALFVARVKGADSLGISGIPVRFQAVVGGGSVRDTVVVTDAQGRARTRGVLGTSAVTNNFSATALGTGLPAAVFLAGANSAVATAIAIVSGNAQVDTVGQLLTLPLSVLVTDAFGNPVPGANVIFTRLLGTGTPALDTISTNASGVAALPYTLGAVTGLDSIRATLQGTSAFVDFTAAGVPGAASQQVVISGAGQTTVVGNLFGAPLVVEVRDAGSNPVGTGTVVHWSVVDTTTATLAADSTLTDALGRASVNVTAGHVAGLIRIEAASAGGIDTLDLTVTPGAAATMVIISGNGQAGAAGIALPLSPEVIVRDAFSNAVAGVTVDFAVVAGGGTIDSTTATTDSTGRANAGLWTLGLAGLNQVRATTTAVPADTLLFDATATPAGTSKLWTGAVDNLWTTPGNWSPAGMPVGGDNLFIPAGVTSPLLNTPTITGGLSIEAGATVTVAAGVTLQLSGNLDLDGDLTGAGNLALTGSGATLSGNTSVALVLINGTLSLNGTTDITGPLNVNGGSLTVGGQTLGVSGALTVGGSGQLLMTNAADSVDVGGNTTFNTNTSGTGDLSAGVLVLRGDFTQTAGSTTNFAPSGTHTTRFLGAGVQAVNFTNPGSAFSRFQEVEFGAASGTTLNSTFTAMGIVTANAGTVTGIGRTANIGGGLVTSYATWQVSTTLWGQNPTVYPDSLPRNVTVFNGWTLTKPFKTDSNLAVNSTGILTLNGNMLRVGGSLTQTGILRMQNTGDTLDVAKGFTVNSSVTGVGELTGGMIRLHGGFTQTAGSFANYQPSGSHVTRFEGSTGQSASFSSPGATSSRFQELELADSVNFGSGITVAGSATLLAGGKAQSIQTATLAGALTDPTNGGWRYQSTILSGTVTSLPDSLVTNLTLQGSWDLAQRTRVTGTFAVSAGAVLDLNGDTLVVSGNVTQNGDLLSTLGSGLFDVGGAFTVNSSSSGTGDLTDGRLILRQGFTQTSGSFSNYAPSGNFLTSFLGSGGHAVSFSSPSVANSHFHLLEVLDSLTFSTAFTATGDATLSSSGRIVGANTGTLLGGLADPSLLGYRMASTIIPGGQVIPGTMTTNLTLTGTWSLPASFTLTGNLTLNGGSLLTVNGHRLAVSGGLTQNGRLQMLLPADTVDVGGALAVTSGTAGTGDLVDGRLILHAGFSQTAGSFSNFAPSSTHVTEFVGTGGHPISFASPSIVQSHFHGLVVQDSLSASTHITVTGDIVLMPTGRIVGGQTGFISGDLADSSLAGWRMATTQLEGRFQSLPSALVTNVILIDSIALAQNTSVTGNWTQQGAGYIAFGGHGLGVSGNFTQNSVLVMSSSQDSLDVGGTFAVTSSVDGTGSLQAGIIVLRGGFTQTAGSFTNFVGAVPHRVRFTGTAPRTISMATPGQTLFGDLNIDATGTITLSNDVNVVGTATIAGGPSTLTAPLQRRLQSADLVVDGATFDRVRVEMHATSNAAQFDNVTFTNIDPALDQLSLELPGQTGDTLRFNNVTFSGTPSTGHYIFVADSVANDAPAVIGFYNSTPLNGALYAAVEGSIGDAATILWTHLDWLTQPTDATELLPILAAPQLAAYDPSGTLVTGYTGTVTLGFFANPVGAVLGNNSVAAVGGVATFDSLTVSLAGIGFQLQATSSELGLSPPSSLFSIFVPIPVGITTSFNNGGGDNDWFNAANWTFGVPDSLDNVYIQPGQTAAVNAPAQVNRMQVGTGGGVLLNAPLTADSTVEAGNTITGGGQLVARGTGFLSGVAGGLVVTGSYLVPVSDTLIADYITISGVGAVLDPGSARIVAIDSLRTEAGGRLDMNDVNAVVAVQGLARFTGGTPALLAGTLEIGGDFSQEENVGAFTPAPGFVTLFNGGGTQTATFFSPDTASDHFGTLALTGGGTLHLASTTVPILGNIDIQGGHVVADTQALVLGTITGATGAFMEGNTLLIRDNFAFGGVYSIHNTIFIGSGQTIQQAVTPFDTVYVQGTASLAGNVAANVLFVTNFGQFDLAGHRLDVTADFGTGSGGIFDMNDAADTVAVGGTFYAMGGSTAGLLTDGLLQIAGSFYQGSTPADTIPVEVQGPPPALDAFRATGTHVTRFVGASGAQRIIFFGSPVLPADPFSTNNSRFGVLELINGIDSLGSTLPVDGDLFVDTASVVNGAFLGGGPAVAGNILVGANVTEFTVTNVSLGGALDFQPAPGFYQVGTTLFFGNGQSIPVLPYQDIEVALGQATLAGNITAVNAKAGVPQEGPGFPGDLRLGGHTLTLSGNFTTTGQGTFTMDDPADTLDVTGNTDLGGGVTTTLTDGTMIVRGDLYLSDSTLVASGTHRVVMAAPSSQQLWITTAPDPSIQFNRLIVLAGTTVNFNAFQVGPLVVADSFAVSGFFLQANPGKKVIALGDLYAGVAAGITVDTVELHADLEIDASGYSTQLTRYAGTGQVITPSAPYNDLEVTGSAELDSNVVVGRDFIVSGNGTFNLIGHTLDVGRDFRTRDNGLVTMQDPADSLRVAYTAFFDGGDTDGLLTAGTLQANYFAQGATTTTRAFRSSGTHRVELMMQDPADQGNTIDIASGGPADSRFNDLILAAGIGAQVNLTGRLEVQDTFEIQPGATGGIFGQAPGATIYAGGAFVVGGGFLVMSFDTLDVGGTIQVPTSILTTPVTRFSGVGQAIPDTQSYQRLEITGSASPEGLGTITTNEIAIYGNGQFTLGANQRATTFGDFTTFGNGTLAMNGAGPDLFIGGNATFAGGSSGPLLGGGNIRVAGNFTTVAGASSDPFNSFNTGVTFQGSGAPQVVTIDPATNVNFRSVGIINPFGIQITGLMLVTDSVGTSGPISGDSLYAFGSLFLNSGVAVQLRVFKTSGLFVGLPSLYDVDRTHMMNANALPNVAFDTLVINADGVSAFTPLNANHLYVAGPGSAFSTGAPASLDLSLNSAIVVHTIQVDAHVEGAGAFLEIGEDTLNVGGDFFTSLGGTLRMSGPGALNVTGSTLFGGASQEGLLTSGTLQIGSGITQQAFSSPSSFRMDGTALDLPLGPAHVMNFETSDSSYLPDLNVPGSGTLNLIIINKTRVAGGISTYGISLAGDTLITEGQLSAGPAGLSVTLDRYEGPVFNQFQNVSNWTVSTTQFTGPGGLPFSSNFAFDTLLVSDSVIGQLSQLLSANYVEVTGPGNPKHIGAEPGVLILSGGDGNTDLNVAGDVVVRGAGAGIANYEGSLTATGMVVDQQGYLYSGGSFGGGSWTINGNVMIDGASTVDSLVRGTLSIGGNFFQANSTSDESFAADSGFTTAFFGGGTHVVQLSTPGPAGTGSHFGSLTLNPDAGLILQTDNDLWVEGLLTTTSYMNPTLQNTAAVMRTITVQDVAIQGITFDHLQLHLAKTSQPTLGADNMDIVNFTNFLTTEDQFLTDLPGLLSGGFTWSNFTFTQLATDGSDTGHYIVATDNDGGLALLITIGTNQRAPGELASYYVGLGGAIVSTFSP